MLPNMEFIPSIYLALKVAKGDFGPHLPEGGKQAVRGGW